MASNRPRILVFTDWYHPGYQAGGPIRSVFNLCNSLRTSADLHVITRHTDYMSNEPYSNVEADRWIELDEGHAVWYCSGQTTFKEAFLKAGSIHNHWDVIYVNGIFSPNFSILPVRLAKRIAHNRLIIAPRGMLAPEALKIKKNKKKIFLYLARLTRLYQKAEWHVTSAEEATQVQHTLGITRVHVIPNLMDNSSMVSYRNIEKRTGELRLISVARIAPEKNLSYALELLHHCKGNIQMDVYGSVYDHSYMNTCQNLAESKPSHIDIQFRGSIPNDELPKILQNYHAMILPTLGENFGHIISESIMAGVPAIISNRTPWNDLDQQAGFVIALENQDDWIARINLLADMDQDTYNKLWNSTVHYAKKACDNTQTLVDYKKMFGAYQ